MRRRQVKSIFLVNLMVLVFLMVLMLFVCVWGGTGRRDETSKVFIFGADGDDFTS